VPGRGVARIDVSQVVKFFVFAFAVLWSALPLRAGEDDKRNFDLPAGQAEPSLKQFSEQSGHQLLFPTELVKGVRTNAVKGEFTSREALDRMLANTSLTAGQDMKTGAFAVWRGTNETDGGANSSEFPVRPNSNPNPTMSKQPHSTFRRFLTLWTAITGASVLAQTAPTPPPANAAEDETVRLSAFKVSSTQDKGYIATTATPFKTKQRIDDIPQAITVVTRDMIDDIGGHDSSDILIYAGAIPKYRSEAFSLRGSNTGVTYPLIDGQIDRTIFMDNLFVDSYEVMRGPAALLYPNTALTGVINKTTRKPLPYALESVRFSITDYGLYRAEVDSTGPLAKVGEGKFSYRVLAAYQDGDAYWRNAKDKRTVFHPSLQFDYQNTSVLLAFDYNDITHPSNPTAVLNIDGTVFTGAGRREINLPPGVMENHKHYGVRMQLLHQFSPNWGVRIGADLNLLRRKGSIVLPIGGVNYQDRTISFFNRKNEIDLNHYSLSMDFNGKYKLFSLPNQSTFGFVYTDMESVTQLSINQDFGVGQRIIRPLDAPNVDTLPVKPFDAYPALGAPGTSGSRIRADLANFYFQQVIDVVPDRLSLVGGVSLYSNETTNNTNIAIRPAVAQIAKLLDTLYRYGVVFKVTKDVSLYAMEANTLLPPTTSKLANGGVVPPAEGKGQEAGVKVDYMDGKISSTLAVFNLKTSGLTVFGGVLPSGETYVNPIGTITQKGFDADLALRVTPNWQIVGTIYSGKVQDQNGGQVDDSYKGSWSLFTRYDFASSTPAKGLSLGGGASRITGRVVISTNITYPVGVTKPPFIDVAPATLMNVFANYKVNKNWSCRLQVDNVLDKVYAVGINAAYLIDPSLPRSFTFAVKYKF